MKPCTIDIYSGEAYNKALHHARDIYWSDGRFCYWGSLYDIQGKVIGDYSATSVQAAEKALGIKFECGN